MGKLNIILHLFKVEFKSLKSTNGGRSTSRWRPRRFQGRIRRPRKRSRSRTWSWSRTRSRSWRQGGKCGRTIVRLIPAPRGTGIVAAGVPKKLLNMAGIEDCYTQARGATSTLGNFAKATYAAIAKTYSYLTPDLWKE